MPNGAQEQVEEEEASRGESQEEWQSNTEGDEDDDDSGGEEEEQEEEEEEEADPSRMERRSKLSHGPSVELGKATVPAGQSTKRPRTSSPAPTHISTNKTKVSRLILSRQSEENMITVGDAELNLVYFV